MNTFEHIYAVVSTIPRGKVASYGQVARLAGNPRMSRIVGYALHVNKNPGHVPCYRVVNRFGEVSSAFAFGGGNRQRELLEADGVQFDENGRVKKEYFIVVHDEL
ncbi:MAG: MGMT family protein [Ruminiclostridium sp.]|nr:MGMT family protein [Ruminiclostridium sp.]